MEQYPTRMSRRSSGQSSRRTVIELKRSYRHMLLIVCVHLAAGGIVAGMELPSVILLLTAAVLLGSLVSAVVAVHRGYGFLSLGKDGALFVRDGGETDWRHAVIRSAFVSGWLIVLSVSDNLNSRHSRIVCFPDSLLPDHFRRLTAFVSLYGPTASSGQADASTR